MTLAMYDSIDLSQFPSNPPAVAGYVGGYWPTYNDLVKKFPNAHHLSIAVQASQRARCLDIEPGDASPAQAPGWFKSLADTSQGLPVLYCSASTAQTVIDTMSSSGVARSRYLLWTAHYTGKAHMCGSGECGYPQADATQWTDKSQGRNLDESLCSDAFFGTAPAPAPSGPDDDVVSLCTVVNLDGRLETFAQTAGGQIWHTWQVSPNAGWAGSAPGKVTTWQSMGTPGG